MSVDNQGKEGRKTAIWLAVACVVGVGTVIVTAVLTEGHPSVLEHVVTELGVALIVAAVIGASIDLVEASRQRQERSKHFSEELKEISDLVEAVRDEFSTRLSESSALLNQIVTTQTKLSEDVHRDVFRAIYGILLGPRVIDEFEQALLLKPFRRANYIYAFRILDLPDHAELNPDDWVLFEVSGSHSLVNSSSRERVFDSFPKIDDIRLQPATEPQFKSYKVRGEEIIESIRMGAGKNLWEIQWHGDKGQDLKEVLTIQPDESVEIEYTFTIAKPVTEHEFFYSFFPCEGMTITVEHDASWEASIDAISVHTRDMDDPIITTADGICHRTWQHPHALLPYQGFELYWHIKRPKRSKRRGRAPALSS